MFCNQCEQTARGTGCTVSGVCGKKPEVAALQDLLTYTARGLSLAALRARRLGIENTAANRYTCLSLFTTLTNVNFDPEAIAGIVRHASSLTRELAAQVSAADKNNTWTEPEVNFTPAPDMEGLLEQAAEYGPPASDETDPDIKSLKQLLVYGLRGVSAYAYHAALLGQEDNRVYAFIHEGMASLSNPDLTLNDRINLAFKCGEINLLAMELLDKANTGTYGHPEPTEVSLGHRRGKCILVSGHDLPDLKNLLIQTEGKGINIYTHGEMLPAHAYPELKKHRHLAGHFGTAWQNQKKEFPQFPGPILMTTNCIQEPQPSYFGNIYTSGPVGWPGIPHLAHGDFSELVAKALQMPGFDADDEDKGTVMTGFARNAVLGVADKIIEAVKGGAIRHFFLVAGCDGAKAGRNYYTEFVEKTPPDTVVLTLACGKYRFFDKKLGHIGDIPRLLDMGQCNDAYSAIQVALALAKAFNCGVNDMPLSMVLSWYEQKAVAILLTLLHLGVKNIRLGPSLPAFVSPGVLNVLVENFGIRPIGTAEQDLSDILGEKS